MDLSRRGFFGMLLAPVVAAVVVKAAPAAPVGLHDSMNPLLQGSIGRWEGTTLYEAGTPYAVNDPLCAEIWSRGLDEEFTTDTLLGMIERANGISPVIRPDRLGRYYMPVRGDVMNSVSGRELITRWG